MNTVYRIFVQRDKLGHQSTPFRGSVHKIDEEMSQEYPPSHSCLKRSKYF